MQMKKVIITGGSRGIGACLVESFKKEGCKVAFTYNNTEVNIAGAKGFKADFASAEQTRKAIIDAIEYLGGVDILINNAGVAHFSLFTWIDFLPNYFKFFSVCQARLSALSVNLYY